MTLEIVIYDGILNELLIGFDLLRDEWWLDMWPKAIGQYLVTLDDVTRVLKLSQIDATSLLSSR